MKELFQKYLGHLLFLAALGIAVFTFQDYGIGWDEPIQRQTGVHNYKYVFEGNRALMNWRANEYGPAFELPLVIIERVLGLQTDRDIYMMRHLVTHLFFLWAAMAMFKLIRLLYKNDLLAAIGFMLLLLHPRIYGHSFFNTKDLPFLSMYVISFYWFALAFIKQKPKYFILLGLGLALLINLRLMGILLFAATLFFLIVDLVAGRSNKESRKQTGRQTLAVVLSTIGFLYATFPYLWEQPLHRFYMAFAKMSKYNWEGGILFNGEVIKSTELGWDYVPTWFSITTPISILILAVVGLGFLLFQILRKPIVQFTDRIERNNLTYLGCFFIPPFVVIILESVLYDGWRHMFFIYPPLVLLCIYGLDKLLAYRYSRIPALAFTIISMIAISWQTMSLYPAQHVYFNELMDKKTPEHLRETFEGDYWGLTYKQALEYILENDASPLIEVSVQNSPGMSNAGMLLPEERKRLKLIYNEEGAGKYFVSAFRWNWKGYPELEGKEWHAIKNGNNSIITIYKLSD